MRKIVGVLFAAVVILGLLLVGSSLKVVQATLVNGIIIQNTTWTKAQSPYTLTGPIAIAQGATLTIEAGVTVNIGPYYFEVNGTLNAQGTPSDKIIINSIGGNAGPPNNYVSFGYMPQSIVLVYDNPVCRIANAILNQTSINGASVVSNATLALNDCFMLGDSEVEVAGITTISNSYFESTVLLRGASTIMSSTFQEGLDVAGGSSGTSFVGTYTISGNNITNQEGNYALNVGNSGTITGNLIWGGTTAGICQADGFPTLSADIEKNLIINNQDGVIIRKGDDNSIIKDNTVTNNTVGIWSPTNLEIITGNNIYGNTQYNVHAGQTAANVANNWWGTTDAAAIGNSIYDGRNDFNLGIITYTPFLTARNSQAAPSNANYPTPIPFGPQTQTATPQPTQTSTPQTPIATQNQPATQLFNLVEVGIFVLLAVIAVLLAAILVNVRKRSG
jgi:Periplasmic copper-binding protein (NosD)